VQPHNSNQQTVSIETGDLPPLGYTEPSRSRQGLTDSFSSAEAIGGRPWQNNVFWSRVRAAWTRSAAMSLNPHRFTKGGRPRLRRQGNSTPSVARKTAEENRERGSLLSPLLRAGRSRFMLSAAAATAAACPAGSLLASHDHTASLPQSRSRARRDPDLGAAHASMSKARWSSTPLPARQHGKPAKPPSSPYRSGDIRGGGSFPEKSRDLPEVVLVGT
jgi:hypothetical protein